MIDIRILHCSVIFTLAEVVLLADTVNTSRPALVAQSEERPTAEPTGSESPVRAASRARCLLVAGMACDQWHRSHYRPEEVSERGGPCPALRDTLNGRL